MRMNANISQERQLNFLQILGSVVSNPVRVDVRLDESPTYAGRSHMLDGRSR